MTLPYLRLSYSSLFEPSYRARCLRLFYKPPSEYRAHVLGILAPSHSCFSSGIPRKLT